MPRRVYTPRKQELPLKGDNTSIFLQVMISIAVFIFAITLSGVLSINSMLYNWNRSILGSLTVQIMPVNSANKEKAAAETLAYQEKAVEFLKTVDGIVKVTPLQDEQLKKLIQPWLGDGVNIDNLPMPRIIDIKLAPDADIDFAQVAQDLAQASPQASLDNHKLWLNKLIQFADGLKLIAMTILILVTGITSGAIFYTTQMSLGLHRNIIEILHIMGAKDGLEGTRCYGAIHDEKANWTAHRYFTKSWVEEDPSVRWLLLQSAPLVVPYRPNASFCATIG